MNIHPLALAFLEKCEASFLRGYDAPTGAVQQAEMTWIAAGCPIYVEPAAADPRLCPRCGSTSRDSKSPGLRLCPKCGTLFTPLVP